MLYYKVSEIYLVSIRCVLVGGKSIWKDKVNYLCNNDKIWKEENGL